MDQTQGVVDGGVQLVQVLGLLSDETMSSQLTPPVASRTAMMRRKPTGSLRANRARRAAARRSIRFHALNGPSRVCPCPRLVFVGRPRCKSDQQSRYGHLTLVLSPELLMVNVPALARGV